MKQLLPLTAAACLLAGLPLACRAQNALTIDATAPDSPPQPVAAALGSATSPSSQTIGANSQYLTLDGKPWLPVMGEFHFSRYPEAEWEEEILKMKAAGVNIISTYVIWIHHEQNEGVFDWQGQRDLRRFTQLCAQHGMYVYPRIGPWAHAEVRNGGLPDWVLKNSPVRQDNPVYLREVQTFYQQIAMQLKGLLWKDGGPVIGLQIENEYRERGPGQGDQHIRTLKQMAVADGLDVPLYTVTGWDGAAIPLDAALPVFGGYPDAPWDGTPAPLPPNEVYAFRFGNRSAGSMGAIGGRGQSGADTYRGTPFLAAEIGDGIEDTYFRRPVVSADDVAAIVPVMLGSGVNLLGYYMFHGGRNPDPEPGTGITLEESQRTGYPTDLPVRSYDFQAPLGEFGQTRESLRKLKLVHYFLADFGPLLAPMQPHAPDLTPSGPADLSVVRVSARTRGQSGFLFFNNHIRSAQDRARPGFQVTLKLPSDTVRIPQTPVTLPAGAYGIWPVNLPLPGVTLRYATAQLFKRIQSHGEEYDFFFSIPGLAPELAFDAHTTVQPSFGQPTLTTSGNLLHVACAANATTELDLPGKLHLIVLPQSIAEQVWRVDDPARLILASTAFFAEGPTLTLDSTAGPAFDFGIFGPHPKPSASAGIVETQGDRDLFDRFRVTLPAVALTAIATPAKAASLRPKSALGDTVSWRPNRIPLAPEDVDFAQYAATWKVQLPAVPPSLSDAFLTVDYKGDVARLTQDGALIDDNFFNGQPWQIGLREIDPRWHTDPGTYQLEILPLRGDSGLMLPASALPAKAVAQTVSLEGITVIPQYRLKITLPVATEK